VKGKRERDGIIAGERHGKKAKLSLTESDKTEKKESPREGRLDYIRLPATIEHRSRLVSGETCRGGKGLIKAG